MILIMSSYITILQKRQITGSNCCFIVLILPQIFDYKPRQSIVGVFPISMGAVYKRVSLETNVHHALIL